jgi:hypothetical protein
VSIVAERPASGYLFGTMGDKTNGLDNFTNEERRVIRRMLDHRDQVPVCPRCKNILRQEGPLAGGGSVGLVWRLTCATCNVASLIAESMSRPRPDAAGPQPG